MSNAIFKNLTTDNMAEAKDTLGGFSRLESDVYPAVIKMAYAGQSQHGAHNVTVVADVNGQEYRETLYVTNRKGENFYVDKNDKSIRHPLPGFTVVDDLCLLTTGHALAEQEAEPKVVKVYNPEEKKEVPTEVPVLMDLIGKTIQLGIIKRIEDKTAKNDQSGEYEPTGETRETNQIDKIFHVESGRTVSEYRHEIDPAEFLPAWTKRNQGKTRDVSQAGKGNAPAGNAGSGRPGGGERKPASKSLFG